MAETTDHSNENDFVTEAVVDLADNLVNKRILPIEFAIEMRKLLEVATEKQLRYLAYAINEGDTAIGERSMY